MNEYSRFRVAILESLGKDLVESGFRRIRNVQYTIALSAETEGRITFGLTDYPNSGEFSVVPFVTIIHEPTMALVELLAAVDLKHPIKTTAGGSLGSITPKGEPVSWDFRIGGGHQRTLKRLQGALDSVAIPWLRSMVTPAQIVAATREGRSGRKGDLNAYYLPALLCILGEYEQSLAAADAWVDKFHQTKFIDPILYSRFRDALSRHVQMLKCK